MTTLSLAFRPSLALSPRLVSILFALLMTCITTSCVAVELTMVNTGIGPGFAERWARSFLLAWPVSFPLVYFVGPRLLRALVRATAA